jgi:hypothetical protein
MCWGKDQKAGHKVRIIHPPTEGIFTRDLYLMISSPRHLKVYYITQRLGAFIYKGEMRVLFITSRDAAPYFYI